MSRPPATRQFAEQVCRALDNSDSPDFRHAVHARTDGADHALVTVQPSQFWRSMPRDAVQTAIAQHLTRWQTVLQTAGYGVVAWSRGEQLAALIVAVDQAAADGQAVEAGRELDDHPEVLV